MPPVNIYEVHLGSWRTNPDDPNGWFNYEEIAQRLIPYVKEAGFNYIELMPVSEHPSDASWGYQNTGFFSPTSRYGTPQQLMTLVDRCHQADIGVILDFVPVHFAVDDYALWNYDGTPLYEYPSWDVGRSEWGSCNFMHSRGEVRSFLQSAAHYWLEEFHFDGLRMDAVRNLLYWQGDEARGTNQGGIQFLRELNRGLKERHPTAMLIAEDSSTYPGVTRRQTRAVWALTTSGIWAGCTTPSPIFSLTRGSAPRNTTSSPSPCSTSTMSAICSPSPTMRWSTARPPFCRR